MGVTDLDPEGGMLTLIMVGLLGIVLIYTVLGGMVAVVLTEYVQFCVLSLGLLVLTWMPPGTSHRLGPAGARP